MKVWLVVVLIMSTACSPAAQSPSDANGGDGGGSTGGPGGGDGGGAGSAQPLLPDVTRHGGPVMVHMQLVPIFYSGDAEATTLTSFSQWIVESQWLQTVGADHGVGTGTVLQVVQREPPHCPLQ